MLLANDRDHHVGTIIGSISTFSPSHYGDVLPFRLPNTGLLGSICSKYFVRPDAAVADERYLRPDVEIDLEDKDAAWGLHRGDVWCFNYSKPVKYRSER